MILVIFIITVLTAITYFHTRRKRFYELSKQFPGPPTLPVIGNGLSFVGSGHDILKSMDKIHSTYNDPVRIWIGPQLLIGFKQPNHIEKLLSSSKLAHKDEFYDFIKCFLGDLIASSGPQQKIHRKTIQPLFNVNFVNKCFDLIQKHANSCTKILHQKLNETFDIHSILHCCCVDIIGEAILGTHIRAQEDQNLDFVEATFKIYELKFARLLKPWLHLDFVYDFTELKKKEDKFMSTINGFIEQTVKEAEKRRNNNVDSLDVNLPIIDQIFYYLDSNPDFMDQDSLISNLKSLFFASEDTLSTFTSFTCLMLGMHPEYQLKAANEIRDVVGNSSNICLEHLEKLKYLDMCIKETQRLFPAGPYISRKVREEFHIDKWILPKNSSIVISIFNVHKDPLQWEKPNEFYPDHFLPDAILKRHPFSFIPFSSGARGCIGKIFAKLSLKVVIATILQKYKIETDEKMEDLTLVMDLAVRSHNGYNVRLKKRK